MARLVDGAVGGGVPGATANATSGNLLCMFAMMLWASGFPAAEHLLNIWDPLTLIVARLTIATTALLVLWLVLEGPQRVLSAPWGRGAIVGGVGFGIGTYLLLLAQELSDPVTVAIFACGMPLAGAALEVLFDNRKIRLPLVLGAIVAVAGGIVATGAQFGDSRFGWGAVCAITSTLTFAWGSRAAVTDLHKISGLGRTTVTLVGAFLFCAASLAVCWLFGWVDHDIPALDAFGWSMLAIYALGAMALSQLLWLSSVGRLGIAVASIHINTAAFYVMVIMVALGASWQWEQAAGAALVALGVFVAQGRMR